MKPKAKTLQERFGFADPELTTPRHDAIMMWLDANVDEFALAHTPAIEDGIEESLRQMEAEVERGKMEHQSAIEYTQREIARLSSEASLKSWEEPELARCIKSLDSAPRIWEETLAHFEAQRALLVAIKPKIEKSWEFVVSSGRNHFTVGFVDMAVTVVRYRVIFSEGGYRRKCSVDTDSKRNTLYFEVKPSIASLGETIRQIRLYEDALGWEAKGKFFIVSSDARFRSQFEAQGIGFLQCPGDL